jgi:hypothetical protein
MVGVFVGFIGPTSGALKQNIGRIRGGRLRGSLRDYEALGLGIYVDGLNSLLNRAIEGLAALGAGSASASECLRRRHFANPAKCSG